MVSILPWIALAIFPVTIVYWLLLLHYRKSGSDLQRLDAGKQFQFSTPPSCYNGASLMRVFIS
jgi:hypothetical protein